MIFRGFAGGYHAKTHLGCLAILLCVYTVFLLVLNFLSSQSLWCLSTVIMIVSSPIIFNISPIEDSNNPLSREEFHRMEKRSRVCVIFTSAILVAILLCKCCETVVFSIAYSLLIIATFLIIGKVKIRKEVYYENNSKN